jgi:hypothetical protein
MILAIAFPAMGSASAQEAHPRIVVSEAGNWFWTTEFNPGTLDLFLYESADEGAALLWSGQQEADLSGFILVGYDIHGQDLVPGNFLVVSDGVHEKGVVLETITMDVFDTENEIMAGTAPAGREVTAVAGMAEAETQAVIHLVADPQSGAWLADFKTVPFDIIEEMRPWSFAQIFDEDGDANEAGTPPPPPNPRFVIFPEWEWFDGNDWPDGATVNITVEGKPECETAKQSWGYFFNGGFPEGCDILAGDIVTFTDGATIRTHTVRNLTVIDVDEEANTVTGTAEVGEIVYVWPHATGQQLQSTVGVSGTWLVDFTDVFDLVEGTDGRSEIRDAQGNSTAVDWRVPNPHFAAFPEWDAIEGWEWPADAVVHLTIDDPATPQSPDYSADETVEPTPWDPNQLWVYFNFANAYDLKPGDEVTLYDGTTTRMHMVRSLAITQVDKEANTVAGTADVGETVYVWPHATGQQLQATADDAGAWLVDFTGLFDLVEGEGGRSEVRDEQGNSTAVDWWIPNPRFVVFPEWEWFDGLDWPNGSIVTITVEGKPECTTTKESSGFFFNGSFGEGCDVVVGDVVTFADGETIRTHTVRNLTITAVDKEADTVAGTADVGDTVYVWPHATGQQLQVMADETGAWLVDFTGLFDLVEGEGGRSEVRDEAGNATAVDWYIPNPRFVVFPEWEWFDGLDWPDGATVTITVEGKPECETAMVSSGNFFNGSFGEGCDIVFGDIITFTDGDTIRTHTVRNLAVTEMNAAEDTVTGTADAGVVVQVWPHGHDQIATLQVTTGDNGVWIADFATVGFNLVPGIGGRSEVGDEAGNKTAVDWSVPMLGWEQINLSGFGDPLTRGVSALEVFRGQIYAGASNWETGGQVWRLSKNGQWLQVIDAGFGSEAANPAVIDLHVFNGGLYAGTGWNTEASGQIWRSFDGINWNPVTTDGFGDVNNIAVTNFIAFKGMLYAGTGSVNGSAQIWRSRTGNSGTWKQVAPDGAGRAGNVTGFEVYKGAIYAAIEPADGFGGPIQVWRSVDGSHWVTVTADGFGDERNESTGGFAQFGGYLYLGTRNEATGAQLWRTRDGTQWEMVVGDGFGDLNNIKIESLFVYDNLLHAATFNPPMGLQLWRSADGTNWEQVTANGFGDSFNVSTLWNSATVKYQGQILIGTWNDVEGGELWNFTP